MYVYMHMYKYSIQQVPLHYFVKMLTLHKMSAAFSFAGYKPSRNPRYDSPSRLASTRVSPNSHVLVLYQMRQADFLRLRVEFARFAPYQCVSAP